MRRFLNYVVQDDDLRAVQGDFDDLLFTDDSDIPPIITQNKLNSSVSRTDSDSASTNTRDDEKSSQDIHNGEHSRNASSSSDIITTIHSISDLQLSDENHTKQNHYQKENTHIEPSTTEIIEREDSGLTLTKEAADKIVHNAARMLRNFSNVDNHYLNSASRKISSEELCEALKGTAEALVWADENDHSVVWDSFLEVAIMPLLVSCLRNATSSTNYKQNADQAINPAEPLTKSQVNNSTITSEEIDAPLQQGNSENSIFVKPSHENISIQTKSDDQNTPIEDTKNTEIDKDVLRHENHYENEVPIEDRSLVNTTENDTIDTVNTSQNSYIADMNLDNYSVVIQSTILQTLSILVQSVSRRSSLLCIFSAGYINDILAFDYDFKNEELVGFFISLVKSICLRLDASLVQLFFDPTESSFPLYSSIARFFDSPESMVRIAVRNITLTLLSLKDEDLLKYIARDDQKLLYNTVELLTRLCGNVARAFELIMDDGREVRRTRSRTGLFQRRVKASEVITRLVEIENLYTYLGEITNVSGTHIRPVVLKLLSTKLFSPLFRPIASRASPNALQLRRRSWRMSRKANSENMLALPIFDAAARTLLLACLLEWSNSPSLSASLIWDLTHRSAEFENRHVLHGLKAMATEVTGTEKVTFISLCAIEAFISSKYVSKQVLHIFRYDFETTDFSKPSDQNIEQSRNELVTIQNSQICESSSSLHEPMLMNLNGFDPPLTPSTSAPPISPALSIASYDSITSPTRFSKAVSVPILESTPHASGDFTNASSFDIADDKKIISSFQLGEISLQEALLSIVLVIRHRETRSMRVIHSIYRIILSVGIRCDQRLFAVSVAKNLLDELATSMRTFLTAKSTTIVAIEQVFDNFRQVANSQSETDEQIPDLEFILFPDRVVHHASEFPKGTGKRRLRTKDDFTPPTEIEDAQVFFNMLHLYEKTLRLADQANSFASILSECIDILSQCRGEESYVDKKYALQDLGAAALVHGRVT